MHNLDYKTVIKQNFLKQFSASKIACESCCRYLSLTVNLKNAKSFTLRFFSDFGFVRTNISNYVKEQLSSTGNS